MDFPLSIIMAKDPSPGLVKTRLAAGIGPTRAAQVAEAMLRCVVARLACRGEVVLAVHPDGSGPSLTNRLGLKRLMSTDQGSGDLGERMLRAWRSCAAEARVAFFGMDSPDVPASSLAAIPAALDTADLAIGPTSDGGYWVLASRTPRPEVLVDIDWGTDSVYHQTIHRAARAGLTVQTLPTWSDIDTPADLNTLRARLRTANVRSTGSDEQRAGSENDQIALRALAERLQMVLDDDGE